MTDDELREQIRASLQNPGTPSPNKYNDPTTGWHWIARTEKARRLGLQPCDLTRWKAENEPLDVETQQNPDDDNQ